MATWALTGDDLQTFSPPAVTDGIYIYGYKASRVQEYDSGSGTSVIISTAAENGTHLLYFKNKLYSIVDDNKIFRWIGGTAWQLVLDLISLSPVISDLIAFIHDGVTMMYVGIQGTTSAGRVVIRHTTDGSSWIIGATDNEPPVHSPSLYPELCEFPCYGQKIAYHQAGFLTMSLGLGGTAPSSWEDRVTTYYLWNGTKFIEKATSANRSMSGTNIDRKYAWRANELTLTDNYAYSTDLISWTQLAQHSRRSVSSNTLYPIGSADAATVKIYLWDLATLDWTVGETVHTGGSGGIRNLIRLDNGNTYCYSATDAKWRIRSDPLGGPGRPAEEDIYSPGQFYYGRGKLIKRSDALIPGTNLGGMALVGKKLFAGSNVNSSPMVAYTEKPTYEIWIDYSGSLSVVAPIKSFSATPWGDSEDLEASEDAVEGGGFQGGTGGRCS